MNPVCYGSVPFVDPANPVCQSCTLVRHCLGVALERVALLPDTVSTRSARLRLESLAQARRGQVAAPVLVSRRGIARRALGPDEERRLDHLPERARSLAKKLALRGWFQYAQRRIDERECPAGIEGTRLESALKRMLAGDFSRPRLVASFMATGLKRSSAEVEASTVLAVIGFGRLRFPSNSQG